jgi:hypothetical protein
MVINMKTTATEASLLSAENTPHILPSKETFVNAIKFKFNVGRLAAFEG